MNNSQENSNDYIKMDFSLETPEERNELVKKIVEQTPPERLTPFYLEKLTQYIFLADKTGKENKKILTDNRLVTVNKRETSFEGLVGKLENGEDGIYNMLADNKHIILTPKVEITAEDIAEIPGMKELKDSIAVVEAEAKKATGRRKYLLKKQIIEMRQDQYVLKNAYRKPMFCTNLIKSFSKLDLSEEITIDENGEVNSTGLINFYKPEHISVLLCNYSKIKEDCWSSFGSDIKWMMMDLDNLIETHLKEQYPLYYKLLIYKIDGKQNLEIQKLLQEEFNILHSIEYISSLWRNKIPKLLAEAAANDWLVWHYTYEEKGQWKKCSRCGQVKLAHNHFFSKNKTSKDHFYSICKACRNAKSKEQKVK